MEIKNKEINKETKKTIVVDIPEGSTQVDKVYRKVDKQESTLKLHKRMKNYTGNTHTKKKEKQLTVKTKIKFKKPH